MRSHYRLGIDAGGTFTDFILADRNGNVRLFKALSTPHDGTEAIGNGLAQISAALGEPVADIVRNCDLCINGTTVALNALIELKGAKVGLLCTAGHEDSLEIRLGHKEEGYRYDADYPPAPMLVPRHLRRPIRGRVLSDGRVHTPLDEDDIRQAVAYFAEQGVESVAISFLWSVRNPAHERRAAEIVREMLPGVFVCVGSEVCPQIREYTRTSTTVVNAYLSPVMGRYVARIDDYFRRLGARRPVRYFQSNGGLATGEHMRQRAVNAINSGPASAPQAGLFVAAPFGVQDVITVDMGGTSFDITLTRGGRTNLNRNVDFLRHRIGVPMIQVETLGAGGGSIAHVNPYGMLEVGPQSAGADPGPACYGRGGTLPTVTDANLVLGYLNPKAVLGGSIRLDPERAHEAIRRAVAEPLGISVAKAAWGIHAIVNANMVNGIRRVSVERGYDPRDFVLIGAGGAAGVHMAALAEDMGVQTVLIPKVASGLCAFGQIISDVRLSYLAAQPMRLDPDADLAALERQFTELEARGIRSLREDGFADAEIAVSRSLEMRYVGQIHECTVEIGDRPVSAATLAEIVAAFHRRHEALYTYSEPHNPVEVVNLETVVIGQVSRPEPPPLCAGDGDPGRALSGSRPMLFGESGHRIDTPVYQGERLLAGDRIAGPAVIEEATTNILVRPGWTAVLESSGAYRMSRNR
ncbi:MAG TPA: hydantoinase/oxoprolinase family protein [Candidatus Competibacteraceae bacterium]|nr:hydantoinase/oxoprolinase family protein [Candidatus Competibacteraceae bacterium]